MNRQALITLIIGLVVVGGIVYVATRNQPNPSSSPAGKTSSATTTSTASAQEASSTMVDNPTPSTTPSGLIIEDETIGSGKEAATGSTVTVDYVGTLTNGTKFDASQDHGQTFSFTVGSGQVIKGWDEGLVGMKEGGKRKLTIPPSLGYGDQAAGTIPPNSTLVFEITLHSIK